MKFSGSPAHVEYNYYKSEVDLLVSCLCLATDADPQVAGLPQDTADGQQRRRCRSCRH